MRKVFIVEDDGDIRELVVYALKSSGFDAVGFEDGRAFFVALNKTVPDLVLLDIMLPVEDGLSILSKLRQSSRVAALPVIMLTAKGSEFDKVKGLDMGADDYVTKPFGVTELVSRINAVLRRSGPHNEPGLLSCGEITLDANRRAVSVLGKDVPLTYKEYELLRYLMLNAGLVLSRERIIASVWGYDFDGESRTIDMHIKTLRQKLGEAGGRIKTVRGVGYKIGAEP